MSTTLPSSSPPPPPPLIDVDCNLWHKDLKPLVASNDDTDTDDLAAILKHDAVQQANIVAVVSPSSTISEATAGLRFLETYNDSSSSQTTTNEGEGEELVADDDASPHRQVRIRTTVGVHPYHVNDHKKKEENGADADSSSLSIMQQELERAQQLIDQYHQDSNNSHVIAAVGECGLDASEGFPPLADQVPWFQAQIDLAVQRQLPLFVHERLAFETTMQLLSDVKNVPVLIHCFTGTPDECRAYIERGYYISLSGYVFKTTGSSSTTRSSSDNGDNDHEQQLPDNETLDCLRQGLIPLNRLMIETDAPYLGFAGCRDLYLDRHAEAVAALSGKKRKKICNNTYPNLPSALPRILDVVWQAFNQGQRRRHQSEVTRDELAWHCSCNANQFFQFGFDDEQLKR